MLKQKIYWNDHMQSQKKKKRKKREKKERKKKRCKESLLEFFTMTMLCICEII